MARKELGYVELEWTCKHCGTVNPGMKRTCSNCGAPMAEDNQFELPDQQELITDKAKLEEAKAGPAIHCPYCNAPNPAGTRLCIQCGGDIEEGLRRKAGEVLGAYQNGPVPDKPCLSCGQMVKADAERCPNCGATLADSYKTATSAPTEAAKKTPLWMIVGGIGIGLVIIIAIIVIIVMSSRTNEVTATVAGLHWQRSVEILAQQPVQRTAWEEDVPQEAQAVSCRDQYRSTNSEPAPKSTEVCGTPYTIDTGSGAGQVVQDCEYLVYSSSCNFTVLDWALVNTAIAEGTNELPTWPEFSLLAGQQEGNRFETYRVTFAAGEQTYVYTAADLSEFSQYQLDAQWLLDINTFGVIKGVRIK